MNRINFDDIDLSKYQKEIDDINKLYEELKNDTKIQIAYKKYVKRRGEIMIKEILKWTLVGVVLCLLFWETITIIDQKEQLDKLYKNITIVIDENNELKNENYELKWENSQTTMYCENEE